MVGAMRKFFIVVNLSKLYFANLSIPEVSPVGRINPFIFRNNNLQLVFIALSLTRVKIEYFYPKSL